MARGNQRDKAREKNMKKLADQKGGNGVRLPGSTTGIRWLE